LKLCLRQVKFVVCNNSNNNNSNILILPEFGAISNIIAYNTFKSEPFDLPGIIYAIIKTAIIGFIV